MSLKFRRFLYITFITAFLIIAPIIMLYAAGYKISKTGINFQKTGMFILDTNPRGAKIYINGKLQQSFIKKIFFQNKSDITTPAKIKNLLPDEYNIKLELDGYWSWQKKLPIYSGASTFAENINLFKKDLPILIQQAKTGKLVLPPQKNKLISINSNQLTLIDLITEEQITATTSITKSSNFYWTSDSTKLLIDKLIIDTNDLNQKIDLSQLLKDDSGNFKIINNRLYYQNQDNLFYFDLQTNISERIISGQLFNDFLIKDDYVYLLTNLKNSVKLNIFKIGSNQIIRTINLPPSINYQFINPEHKLLNIYDESSQILYLIDPLLASPYTLIETIHYIKYGLWINENKLLYINDFEIWSFDLASKEKTLITRISDTIHGIIWHPSNNYIIYSTSQSINTIELDEREKRNITELVKFDNISPPVIDKEGKILYFYAKIGNQEGLYKLAI